MQYRQLASIGSGGAFREAVNVTLGLPIVRTSVDHGTALDLAASGNADANSMVHAIEAAISLSTHSTPHS